MEAATGWIVSHTATLSALQIPITSIAFAMSPEICAAITHDGPHDVMCDADGSGSGEGLVEHSDDQPMKDAVDEVLLRDASLVSVKPEDENEGPVVIHYPDIKLLVESANGIIVKFPELTYVFRYDGCNLMQFK